jgi:hypothetical protein
VEADLIIHSKRVLTPEGIKDATVFIRDGKIIDVINGKPHVNGEIIDAGDSVLMPGLIDSHVHINEPGRTDWEGFETATKAAAAGGITTLVDMPLNSSPVTTTVKAFREKLEAAKGKLFVNCGFWGGLVPGNTDDIQPLIDERASEEQRDALLQILSGQNGGTFFEVLAFVAPNVKEPLYLPIEFEADLEKRSANIRYGDVVETNTETLRGIDPPDPYRILIKIPGGMEYTNEAGEAEVASAKRIKSTGAIPFDIENGHSSLAFVRHGNKVETAEYHPTVVGG